MPDDMPEIPHRAVVRDHHAPLGKFKETADPFGDEPACRVRLLEMEV
jgi:hypothetical protein